MSSLLDNKELHLKDYLHSAVFASLTAVGAISAFAIPFGPVPITLQMVFIYLAGGLLGARKAALSQVIYLIMGVIGLPVFSRGGAGIGHLMGPSGGYIFGFIAGAFVIGYISSSKKRFSLEISMVLGTLVIYAIGSLQLMLVTGMSYDKALMVGVVPFIPLDAMKMIIALYVITRIKTLGFHLDDRV